MVGKSEWVRMSIVDRIRKFIHESTRATESGSERDGALSYSGEWHAVAIGAALGLIAAVTMNEVVFVAVFLIITGKAKVSNDHIRDAVKEAAYTSGAFVAVFALIFVLS